MVEQHNLQFQTKGRSSFDITAHVAQVLEESALQVGVVHVFARHTSCSLIITENADADVRRDLETLAERWAPDGDPAYRHDLEGVDDMAAHARTVLAGTTVSVPFANRCLLLGVWQGLYLWEHRSHGQLREVVVTVMG